MKPEQYLLLLSIILLFSQSACKKSETPEEKTRTDLLTQKPWVMVGHRVNWTNASREWEDIFEINDCLSDDIYTFNKGGTCQRDAGAVKCAPEHPQTVNGTWMWYVIDGAIKTNEIGLFNGPFIFKQLDDEKMVLLNDFANEEYTFVHP